MIKQKMTRKLRVSATLTYIKNVMVCYSDNHAIIEDHSIELHQYLRDTRKRKRLIMKLRRNRGKKLQDLGLTQKISSPSEVQSDFSRD